MARTYNQQNDGAGSPASGPGHLATIFVRCGNEPAWAGPVPPPAQTIHAVQPECHEFTLKEHLRIQREIERRAYRYWRMGGGANNELNHWLRAEKEVLTEFVLARMPAGLESQITKNSCL
jgi:hypothetical protein